MDKYQIIDLLGKDRFGGCFKCRNQETGELALVDVININIGPGFEGVPGSVISKISVLRDMKHPNFLRLLDVVVDREHGRVLKVHEFEGCDLKTFMKERPDVCKESLFLKRILHQILLCVSYYHSNELVHGRLTPHVVMINLANGNVKIADIGINVCPSSKAPEILLGDPQLSSPADIWSVGSIFGEMVNLQPPFLAPTEFREMVNIFSIMGTPSEENWPGSTKRYDIVRIFDNSSPKDLATVFPSLDQSGLDLLSRMLRLDPRQRITVSQALDHEYFRDLEIDPIAGSSSDP